MSRPATPLCLLLQLASKSATRYSFEPYQYALSHQQLIEHLFIVVKDVLPRNFALIAPHMRLMSHDFAGDEACDVFQRFLLLRWLRMNMRDGGLVGGERTVICSLVRLEVLSALEAETKAGLTRVQSSRFGTSALHLATLHTARRSIELGKETLRRLSQASQKEPYPASKTPAVK